MGNFDPKGSKLKFVPLTSAGIVSIRRRALHKNSKQKTKNKKTKNKKTKSKKTKNKEQKTKTLLLYLSPLS